MGESAKFPGTFTDTRLAGSHKREFSTSSNGREKFRRKGDADLIPPPPVEDFRKQANDVNYTANADQIAIPETDSPSGQQHHPSSYLSDSDSESSKRDADMTTPPPSKPKKQYCSFVRQLRKKYPAMKETVNQIKQRPTAVDMIQQDSERQLEQAK
jgi:hypothetical protein